MAILHSGHKAGQTKPQAKSFKELISRLGQRSELAAPGYEDSTKRGIAYVWGRWTEYVYPCMHRPRPPLQAEANKALPDIVRKSTTSPTISALLILSKFARTIYTMKESLIKGAYEYSLECDADVYMSIRIHKNGRVFTCNSDSTGE